MNGVPILTPQPRRGIMGACAGGRPGRWLRGLRAGCGGRWPRRCPVFEKFAQTPKKTVRAKSELPKTAAFLTAIRDNGFRLSYGALAVASRLLGEDSSGQIPAQRGAALVKGLAVDLQPYVCRREGGYAKGVTWDVVVPADLRDRPVVDVPDVEAAIEEWSAA